MKFAVKSLLDKAVCATVVPALEKMADVKEKHPTLGKDAALAYHAASQGAIRLLASAASKEAMLSAAKGACRSGALGAAVDGAFACREVYVFQKEGLLDTKTAATHVGKEMLCGFTSTACGTLGTAGVTLVVGSMGPAALLTGMACSIGTRYMYRQMVPSSLPAREGTYVGPLAEPDQEAMEKIRSRIKSASPPAQKEETED